MTSKPIPEVLSAEYEALKAPRYYIEMGLRAWKIEAASGTVYGAYTVKYKIDALLASGGEQP